MSTFGLITTLIILSTNYSPLIALTGYICGEGSPNITTVSTSTIGPCEPVWNEPETKDIHIQLLQLSKFQPTDIFGCKIKIFREIKYCGMHSHTSDILNGDDTFVSDINREACREMVKYGYYKHDNVVLRDLINNVTNFRTVVLAGSLTSGGACSGTTFLSKNIEFKDVFVKDRLEITLYDGVAVDQGDELILPSNTVCIYKKGSCVDTERTHYFWSLNPTSSCRFELYTILYEGISTRVTDTSNNNPTIYFANTTENIQFGLARSGPLSVCGYIIYATEHSKLFIYETNNQPGFTTQKSLDIHDVLSSAYFNTKLAYLARHVETQVRNLYKDSVLHRCYLARQIILNSISYLETHPDLFALAVMKTRGYTAVSAGEIAHIIQCVPVNCIFRHTNLCYNELPVTCGNHSRFLKPNSHILIPLGTPKDCSNVVPPMFDVDGTWIKYNPNATIAQTPQIIQPLEIPTYDYFQIPRFITSGIYPIDELDKLQDHFMFPLKHTALLQSVVRRLSSKSHPIENGNFGNLIDENVFEKMTQSYFDKIFSGFLQFGTFCAGIMGIMTIFHILKGVIDTIIHGYTLYTIYGWSIRLLAAIFGSITNLFVLQSHKFHQSDTELSPLSNNQHSSPTNQPTLPSDTFSRHHKSSRTLPTRRTRSQERSVAELERSLLNK